MSTFFGRKKNLCADKIKMLVFNRKKREKDIWKWRAKRIKEVHLNI